MDTFTSSDHCAHTAVPPTAEASLRIDALSGSTAPHLHFYIAEKVTPGRTTCYSKRTRRIPDAKYNYTPGRRTVADLCLSDILVFIVAPRKNPLYRVRFVRSDDGSEVGSLKTPD